MWRVGSRDWREGERVLERERGRGVGRKEGSILEGRGLGWEEKRGLGSEEGKVEEGWTERVETI